MRRGKPRSAAQGASAEAPLTARPGFLLRRLHQIHVALFLEECAEFGITPVQYSVMTVLTVQGTLDQAALAREVGIDRANATDVVRRLEERDLLSRTSGDHDNRVKLCTLTAVGVALTQRMQAAVERAHERTVEGLPPRERKAFLASLQRLVESNNDMGRTKLRLR
ncbi:MAG: MarR family transcriptional regulator [Burkholderiales bacterium]|nr:MarR family transcriptional regulator [Burkholderiales bacterium]